MRTPKGPTPFLELPPELQQLLTEHRLVPGRRIPKGGRLRVSDEALFAEYESLRDDGLGKYAAFLELADEHGMSFSTIRRHIERYGKPESSDETPGTWALTGAQMGAHTGGVAGCAETPALSHAQGGPRGPGISPGISTPKGGKS